MKQADIRFTYQDYLLLSDDKRYELLEGELYVVPAPKIYHQRISRNLGTVLLDHIRRHDLGEILFAPCDVVLSHENVVHPDLLVEILSEATKQRDVDIKRKLYAKYGVREYWIVDPGAKTVEILVWKER